MLSLTLQHQCTDCRHSWVQCELNRRYRKSEDSYHSFQHPHETYWKVSGDVVVVSQVNQALLYPLNYQYYTLWNFYMQVHHYRRFMEAEYQQCPLRC